MPEVSKLKRLAVTAEIHGTGTRWKLYQRPILLDIGCYYYYCQQKPGHGMRGVALIAVLLVELILTCRFAASLSGLC